MLAGLLDFLVTILVRLILGRRSHMLSWARSYKTFFMLNSAEHELFPAHKSLNANNWLHFNIYEHKK